MRHAPLMGVRNYLVERLSGTGKTAVCDELQRRGFEAVHGDRELAYQGDPSTGEPLPGGSHDHHIWDLDRLRARAANQDRAVTFFCGGARNFAAFIGLFDGAFVLKVDRQTLTDRLDRRPSTEWGGKPADRQRILRWHVTGEGLPGNAVEVDASMPLPDVVDAILRHLELLDSWTD